MGTKTTCDECGKQITNNTKMVDLISDGYLFRVHVFDAINIGSNNPKDLCYDCATKIIGRAIKSLQESM
jgi:predicted RNA-binding Zn-ribbon protein involved in translation (DUF1610 family)